MTDWSRVSLLVGAVLAGLAYPAQAQPSQPPAAQPSASAGQPSDENGDDEEIVVTGKPPRGSVIGDIPPENVVGSNAARATGATNLDELLESLAPDLGSALEPGGARPVVLLNGRRVSSYRELRDIPIEAIQRVDILPEEVALKYGAPADEKVVNIVLKPHFKSTTAQVAGNTASGGYIGGNGDVTRMQIDEDRRTTLNAHVGGDDVLTTAQRNLSQQQNADVLAAGSVPSEFKLRSEATVKRILNGGADATANAEVEHDEGRSLNGLTDQISTKLRRETMTDSLRTGAALNADSGQWHWSVTGDADFERTESKADNDGLAAAPDRAHSTRTAADLDATLNGNLFALPAGQASATVDVGGNLEELDVDELHVGEWAPRTTGRTSAKGALSLDVPIAHHGHALGALGNLTVNGNAEVDQLSDFGTLTKLGAGANWSPMPRLNLIGSWSREEDAPSVRELGAPILETPETAIFDFTNGVLARVGVITGGNPNLDNETDHILKLGGTWQPLPNASLKLRADYAHISIDRPISAITLLPAIEAAFPGRFVRSPGGDLVSADLRPVNFDKAQRQTLRLGFDFSKALRSRRPSNSEIQKALETARKAGLTIPESEATAPNADSALAAAYHGRLQFSLTDTITLVDRAEIAPGFPRLDYLHGAAIGQIGGEPRHQVQAQAGWFNNGIGARFSFNWRSATDVETLNDGDLHFASLATFDLRLFANIGQDLALLSKLPWLRGSSIRFEVANLLNTRPDVRNAAGMHPPGFGASQLDPLGRTVMISFRKQFLPRSYYQNQLQNLQQRVSQLPQ